MPPTGNKSVHINLYSDYADLVHQIGWGIIPTAIVLRTGYVGIPMLVIMAIISMVRRLCLRESRL